MGLSKKKGGMVTLNSIEMRIEDLPAVRFEISPALLFETERHFDETMSLRFEFRVVEIRTREICPGGIEF